MRDPARCARRRAPRRVLLGLTEVAGYYTQLAAALRAEGLDATLVDLSDHPFRYGQPAPNALARWTIAVFRRRTAAEHRGAPMAAAWKALEAVLRVALLLWAAARFDAFVFGFGVTFLGWHEFELRLLRRLGKRVIVVFHGSDSRPPYLDGSIMARDRGRTVEECIRLSREQKRRVQVIDRLADMVIDHPLTAHFHERLCVQWLMIGIPSPPPLVDDAPGAPGELQERGRPVRILHSPSHPEAKGSPRIRAAVEEVRSHGHAVELVEITGRPNQEVLAALAACDFVVDQLYSDTPMAGFAAEAARLGKAAVVGGYGAAELARAVPEAAIPPSLFCHPDALVDTIERLVANPAERLALGAQAKAFVADRWAPQRVAQRFRRLLDGDAPAEWLFDPREIRYTGGCALPNERVRELVGAVLEQGGVQALQLGDKPALERLVVALARNQPASPVTACCGDS